MLLGVLDPDSKVLWESREASTGQTEDELVELLVREIERGAEDMPRRRRGRSRHSGDDRSRQAAIAVSAVNLPLENLPIRDLIGERTGLPVFVDNDATVAALAEHLYGAARGAENAVMLTIGTGIGGGLILGGEIYRGSTGAGAELGHTVIEADGPPCQGNCPGHGCVETLASGTALGREGRAAAEREPDSALGRDARRRRDDRRQGRDRGRARRRRDRARRLRSDRLAPRRRPDQLRQHLRARRLRHRRRRDRRRRPAARAGSPRARASGRCRR